MDARDFLSEYLHREDLDRPATVTISSVEKAVLGDDQTAKMVIRFEELKRGLVLNKGNLRAVMDIADTSDTSRWIGVKVEIYVDDDVTFGGRRVGGLRVRSTTDAETAF